MSTVPTDKVGKIEFYEAHIDTWTSNYAEIGVSLADCGALAALITTARENLTAQVEAADVARSRTLTCNGSVNAMHTLGGSMIQRIRAYAEATNSNQVYADANIPAPAPHTPAPPPGKPSDFTAEILATGALLLRWSCDNPVNTGGTVYEVRRQIGTAPMTMIGAGGSDKVFEDDTLPRGSAAVQYVINGLRGTKRGPAVQFTVNFGVAGGGGMTVQSVIEGGTVNAKLAA